MRARVLLAVVASGVVVMAVSMTVAVYQESGWLHALAIGGAWTAAVGFLAWMLETTQ